MSDVDNRPVLVYGATGMQGGMVLRGLLNAGIPVRALVRDAAQAKPLADLGATLAVGTFEDEASLIAASKGVRAIFSMQNAPLVDKDSERLEVRNVIAAAKAAGVAQVVHTSVSGAGAHRSMPDWAIGSWVDNYIKSKTEAQAAVRAAGFKYCTVVQPPMIMENFFRPKSDFLFPDLIDDALVTVFRSETEMALVAGSDLGRIVAAAVLDPERFHGAVIGLAGDRLTMSEIAATLSAATGRRITAKTVSPDEALARGQYPDWVTYQKWLDTIGGYPAKPTEFEACGIKPVALREWATQHAGRIARR